MKENGKLRFIYTWPVIILFWILFWPVGIVLTCIRVSFEKPGFRGVMVLNIFAVLYYVAGVLILFVELKEGVLTEADIPGIIFIFVFALAHQLFALKKRAKLLAAENRHSKDHNQSNARTYTTTQTSEAVKRTDSTNIPKKEDTVASKKNVPPKMGKRTIVCPNCGAHNVVYTVTGECEYCGSVLK